MAYCNLQSITRSQLAILPKQTINCPNELIALDRYRDETTGITTYNFCSTTDELRI